MSPYMTIEEAAHYFNCSYQTVYRRVKAQKIPARYVGGWRLDRQAVEVYDESGHRPRAKVTSISKFQSARLRLRSLKTEFTESPQTGAG